MARHNSPVGHLCIFVTLFISISLGPCGALPEKGSAFFIFGDSIVDPGNNNYIDTVPNMRADAKPYGQNGFFKEPTGRFSDGRVVVDFIAEYAKLPIIPAFLNPSSIDYTNGVNFASGGGGVLPHSNKGLVIDLQTQFKYFEVVQKPIAEKLGEAQAKELIKEAVYFFSIGSNDYLGGYLNNPKMRENYTPEEYVGMVIGNFTHSIQALYANGARKFAFLGLFALGCLPILRASSHTASEGGCLEAASSFALAHNKAWKAVLRGLEHLLKGFKYSYSDFYNWLEDRMNNPSKYGLKDGVSACCGAGRYRGIYSCGGQREDAEFQVCDNADDYVWWDSYHLSERTHDQFAKAIWNASPFSIGPYSLEELFFDKEKRAIADVVDVPEGEHFQ